MLPAKYIIDFKPSARANNQLEVNLLRFGPKKDQRIQLPQFVVYSLVSVVISLFSTAVVRFLIQKKGKK